MLNLSVVPTTANNDAELVKATLTGDRDAFEQIVARYQALICTLTYNATGNLGHSEDLAQETFVTAWKQLADLREPEKLRAWLCGIARNLINNSLRKQQREPSHAAEPLEQISASHSPEPLPVDHTISKEEQAILWRSLEKIPDIYRDPLVLFYRENQSVEAVAEKLELTPDAVHQRLSRGRKLLAEEVTAFVEGALARTNPGTTFTLAVLTALPAMTLSAKAATLGAAAKGGATAKGASFLALAGAVIAPLFAFFGMWVDYRLKKKAGHPPLELKKLKLRYLTTTLGVAVFVLLCSVLMSLGGSIIQTHPGLFAILITGLIVSALIAIGASFQHSKRADRNLAALQPHAPARRPLWEYRSRFELFGLPFIHIRFIGWFGCSAEERAKAYQPLKAWIAITDGSAIGVLFAYGASAFAPISVGVVSVGFLSFGAVSIGALAVGGFGFGVWALAPFAFAWQAYGDCAIAWNLAFGGRYAIAHHFALGDAAHALQVNNDFVRQLVRDNPFFNFCMTHMTVSRMILITWIWIVPVLISNIIRGGMLTKNLRLKKSEASKLAILLFAFVTLHASAGTNAPTSDRFTVTVRGKGPDILLVPGLTSSSAVWDTTAKQLEAHYRLHLIQIAGFAGSPAQANASGEVIQPTLDALDRYIKTKQLKSPKFIGHSLGGLMGMMLAIQHPEDVGKLLVVDALPFFGAIRGATNTAAVAPQAAMMRDFIINGTQEAYAQNQTQFLRILVKSPEGRKLAIDWAIASDKSVVARAMYEDLMTDLRPDLVKIKSPVTVLYPWDAQSGFPRAATEKLYRDNFATLPGAKLVCIEASFHFIMLDQPEKFAAATDTFLKP